MVPPVANRTADKYSATLRGAGKIVEIEQMIATLSAIADTDH
jgi:hypothetical protein